MPRKTEQHVINAVLEEFEDGASIKTIAKRYDLSESTVRRIREADETERELVRLREVKATKQDEKELKKALKGVRDSHPKAKLPEIKATKELERAIDQALKDVKAGRTKTIDPNKPISEQLLGAEYSLENALFIKQEYGFMYTVREVIINIQVFFLFAHLFGVAPNDYFLIASTCLFVPQVAIAVFLGLIGVKKLYVESSDGKAGTFSLK